MRAKIPYWYLLLGPVLLYTLGYFLNWLVLWTNGGQMPIFPPGGCDGGWIHNDSNGVPRWVCGGAATHLKLLSDIFYSHAMSGVFSVGDLLEWQEESTFWPALTAWCALMIRDSKDGK